MKAGITRFEPRAVCAPLEPDGYSRNIAPERGGVAAHYSGGAHPVDSHGDCIAYWRGFQRYHMKTLGWDDVAYTGGFCQHGAALAGRGVGVRTAANGTNDANDRYYAVCFIGGGDQVPTDLAVQALAWWIRKLRASGGAGQSVVSHSTFKATACCGDPLRARLGQAAALAAGRDVSVDGGESGPVLPVPVPTDDSWTERIIADLPVLDLSDITRSSGTWIGYPRGSAHVRTLQALLVARGQAPRNTIRPDGTLDGIAGPGTRDAVRALQQSSPWTYSTAQPDLIVGQLTWRVLHRLGRP